MAEYIDRDKVLDAVLELPPKMDAQGYGWIARGGLYQLIRDFQSADVVPVVRCKDCLHSKLNEIDNESYICKLSGYLFAPNFYCASGGKRAEL